MRTISVMLLLVACVHADPKIIIKPDAFETLVNPNCSHCVDEAKRRKEELKDNDPVLMWTRGKYDGGAIPFRFFLNPYRVISDTYGVFVYDPDAGYARGFTASLDFKFHGWRNGVMVMKHKDGTLFSCLTGVAFDGPRKGERLESWPTLVSKWGWVMKSYPDTVAYHMFEKYKPVELPKQANEDSVRSRGEPDKRLAADTPVLGVWIPSKKPAARAYPLVPLHRGRTGHVVTEEIEGVRIAVLFDATAEAWSAYQLIAEKRDKTEKLSVEGKQLESRDALDLVADQTPGKAPFVDRKTGTRFDVAGRGVEGELKGWTLKALDSVVVKWFAWSAEVPQTTIWQAPKSDAPPPVGTPTTTPAKVDPKDAIKEVAGTAEFLRAIPKKFAKVQSVDVKSRTIRLLIDGDKEESTWPLTPDAEIKIDGWWGRIEQITAGSRVWAWFHTDRKKKPISVFMLANETSEKDIHGSKDLPADMNDRRTKQKAWLRDQWIKEGLPSSVTFVHVAGEADLMLDHEAMRWARSLQVGDKVSIAMDPAINAVVKDVKPWRERTQVRLVINGLDITDLQIGQRVHLKMPPPAKEIEESDYPADIGRKRSKEDRIDWFLASIYCTCKVANDICTGDFYTLASCNPNGCGMPNGTRRKIATMIDKGMDDKQIWDDLRAERGTLMTKPHLVP